MKTKILADFHICIGVPLTKILCIDTYLLVSAFSKKTIGKHYKGIYVRSSAGKPYNVRTYRFMVNI